MVELCEIIDMIYMVNDNPIYILNSDGEVFEYNEDDLTDVLTYTVSSIDIYNDKVEIYLED